MKKKVKDLVTGDKTEWWTAHEKTFYDGDDFILEVIFPDGSEGVRYWKDGNHEVVLIESPPSSEEAVCPFCGHPYPLSLSSPPCGCPND